MMTPWQIFLVKIGRYLAHPRLRRFLLHPLTRYWLAWLITLGGAGVSLYFAWISFDSGTRRDGNAGHTTIDFGGQYLMGRMLVRGYGQHLYHRLYQLQVLREAYPQADEDPKQEKSDVDNLMGWTMTVDQEVDLKVRVGAYLSPLAARNGLEASILAAADQHVNVQDIGGPLYPPLNAFYYYPLALLGPLTSYHTFQVVGVLLTIVAGLGIRVLSRGRIWWPVATGFLMTFPGYFGSLNLGQNAILTLTILIWGWALIARGWPGSGGMVWGFLAFKPVWALSFLLVPLLTRRWRVCMTMVGTAAVLATLTLPVVGSHSWFDWVKVGEEATNTYNADDNWIHLSRDLLSLPRRCLDFAPEHYHERQEDVLTTVIGWALLIGVLVATVCVVVLAAVLRREPMHAVTGPQPAFLFLAAWLVCFHFMYYDTLLAALPIVLLFVDWRRYLDPILIALVPLSGLPLPENLRGYYAPRPPQAYPSARLVLQPRRGQIWVLNSLIPNLAALLLALYPIFHPLGLDMYRFPYDTIVLLAFWLWCAWLCLRPVRVHPTVEAKHDRSLDGQVADSAAYSPQLIQLGAHVASPH
jgi:hypothetical protein